MKNTQTTIFAKPSGWRFSSRRHSLLKKNAAVLDISGDTVRAAEVNRSSGGYRLLRRGSAVIARQTPADLQDGHDEVGALAAAIKSAMAEAGISKRDVVVNLPGEALSCSVESMTAMTLDEREAVLRRQAVEQCGSEPAWDYTLLSDEKDERHQVLSAAAPAEQVERCIEALNACGLKALKISPSALAILQAYMQLGHRSEDTVALVHFSQHSATVIVIEREIPMLIRQIRRDERRAASYVAEEISRTLIYFKQQNKGRQTNKLFYCGDTGGIIDLVVNDADIDAEDISEKICASSDSEYVTAAALGVMALSGCEIDLLPDRMKEARSFRSRSAVLAFLAILVVAGYAFCLAALATAGNIYAGARDQLDGQLQVFEPIREMHNDIESIRQRLRERQELHTRFSDDDLPWAYLLWKLATLLPPEAGVTDMVVESSTTSAGSIRSLKIAGELTGIGGRRPLMLQVLRDNLAESGLFRAVHLEPVSETTGGGVMRFMMRCELAEPDTWPKL